MKKVLLFVLIASFSFSGLYAQKTVSGKSQPTLLTLNPEFKRGLPPDLYVNLNFEDDNHNGILEADEAAVIKLHITNKGKGPAQGLLVKIEDNYYDPNLTIKDGKKIPYLYPGQSVDVEIPLKAGFDIKTAEHKFKIVVTEHFGYDMDDAYMILNTLKYQAPQLVFSGLNIVDAGEGTGPINEDMQLQAGELVKIKVVVQNIGQNIAYNTNYKVSTTDKNIYLDNNKGNLGDLAIGEVKSFWITVSPNKRVQTSGTLPIYLTMTCKYNVGDLKNKLLPIVLNQKPATPEIVQVKVNIENIKQQVVKFEYTSNKITANIGNVIDIRQVSPSGTVRGNAVAIVIGIENYDNITPAPYAANDAKIITKYFKDVLGIQQVFTYTDRDVSGYFFNNTFNPSYGELQKAIIKGKTDLYVFYSGHGLPSKDGKKVFLFPSDGRIEALAQQGYDLNKFYEDLEALGAKSTTVFIDACFSGVSRATETQNIQNLVAMKGVYIKPHIEKPWEQNPNFTLFSSSSLNETSLGFDPSKTGLFTYYLCAGLQGKADTNKDKKITMRELKNYVTKHVSETSVKILGKQTPVFHGDENTVLVQY